MRAPSPGAAAPPRSTSWGEVISHALRNPYLADALGLRYEFTTTPNEVDGKITNVREYMDTQLVTETFGPDGSS